MIKVLVADRGQANLYDTVRLGSGLEHVLTLTNPTAHLHERDLVSDAAGRSFNRNSGMRPSYGARHSLRDQATQRFVREIGKSVTSSLRSSRFEGLVLVAAPRLLSQLRKAIPRTIQSRIVGEIAKDFCHQSPHQINQQLRYSATAQVGHEKPIRLR